jgi:dihydroflavonol-4-reductase
MTVVITGASGHIGSCLTRALLEQGRRIRAVIFERSDSLNGLPIEAVPGDVRDLDSLKRAFTGAEVVYHLAAKIVLTEENEAEVFAINEGGPRNVCQAAKECGVKRLVHFSSIHALDDRPHHIPVDEERPPSGGGFPLYDRSKAAGEKIVREYVRGGLHAVILNPTGVIGPFDFEPSAMGHVFLGLYHRRLPALVDGGFDFVDVRDVVNGAISAETKGRPGERYLLSGHWAKTTELAEIAASVTGRRPPRFVSPLALARLSAPLAVLVARLLKRPPLYTPASIRALGANRDINHDKAARELGYTARPLQDSVRDIYSWFQQAGRLGEIGHPRTTY